MHHLATVLVIRAACVCPVDRTTLHHEVVARLEREYPAIPGENQYWPVRIIKEGVELREAEKAA